METYFILFCFKLRGISFEISFTTPSKVSIMFDFIWSIIFDTPQTLCIAHKSSMTPFPAVFALENTYVHICPSYSSNEIAYVKISVDEIFGFTTTLDIPYIYLGDALITQSLKARSTLLNIYIFLIINSTILKLIGVLLFFIK